MPQIDFFHALQSSGESIDTEFKSARGGMPGSFWESYCAMANTQGGTIVLGVAEKSTGLVWEGVPDAAQLRTVLWGQLNDRQKISTNLLHDDDVQTLEDGGRKFVAVTVPRASRLQRPVYVGPNPMTGTYRRAEEGDYRCSTDEVRRMLADQSDTPADLQVLEHYHQADFDPETVKQYRNRFASRAPDHPWLLLDDTALLTKLSALRRDRVAGIEGATVAGLLMFGRFDALREALPGYHVDYRERLSDDPAVRWTDRVVPDGTWENNLFQFYIRVMQRLSGNLKIPFQLDQQLYRKDDSPVHEALREAVVNALVHADHRGQGGVVIERYPDRIELSNPGSLLVSRVQLLQGGVSECRNKSLQLMFQLMGGGDKAGSGMDKIWAGWRTQHWRSPRVEELLQPDRVKLVLPMVSLIPEEVDQALRVRFGDRFTQLEKTGVQAVVTAQVEGAVTNGRMQEITGEHSKDITSVLQNLVRDGLLMQKNQRRWASYHITPDAPPLSGDSRHLDGDSRHLDGDSRHLDGDSRHLTAELLSLALPARHKGKLPATQMKDLILSLCKACWLTAKDLATLLNRDAENLQRRILTGLVKSGLLELRYPDVPNRPDQAYKTVAEKSDI